MELIRCPQCAKEIPDVSRFCRRCGSAVAWGMSTATVASSSSSSSWAGLPRSAWDADRPPQTAAAASPGSRNRYKSASRPLTPGVKRGGSSAWVASVMIGVASFVFMSHVRRATTGPMIAPRPVPVERIRTSPVRSVPPPQFYYPRPGGAGGSSSWSSSPNRRIVVEPPVMAPAPPMPGNGWDDRYPSRSPRDGRGRSAGWGED